jgi:hypothetical protein
VTNTQDGVRNSHANPTPGYQVAGPNEPQFPGLQVYPPRCLETTLACGFRYHPDTGTCQPATD